MYEQYEAFDELEDEFLEKEEEYTALVAGDVYKRQVYRVVIINLINLFKSGSNE